MVPEPIPWSADKATSARMGIPWVARSEAICAEGALLVEFLPLKSGQHADAYFALLESLEALFGRPVDLLMVGAIKNPYFLQSVNQTRMVVYAA